MPPERDPSDQQLNLKARRTAAVLTPFGRGAVATIRVVGDLSSPAECTSTIAIGSLFRAANRLPVDQQPLNKIAFGQWGMTDPEDLVICRTANDMLEIHCHGGDAAVRRILSDLSAADFEIIDWRQQIACTTDILNCECLEVLSRTTTSKTTEIVLEQSNGLLNSAIAKLKGFDGDSILSMHRQLDDLLQWASFGLHLSMPWSVTLTGRPNVGKSSLINALLGYQRSIVFDQPGTTRDVVTGETALEGWPIIFADTAGIRHGAGELESAGIALARERLHAADLRLVLIDLSQAPTSDDDELLSQWPDGLVVAHKCDLPDQWNDRLPSQTVKVSSLLGEGVVELQRMIVNRLIPVVPPPGAPIPITARQVDLLRAARMSSTSIEIRELIQRL
ncbi:MAG: GTPase [Schlesneria sp.]